MDAQQADSRSKFAAVGTIVTAVADPYRDGDKIFIATARTLRTDGARTV